MTKSRTFWIDENLPPRLAVVLSSRDDQKAVHFRDLSLLEIPDRDVFLQARDRGATIVSKDEDFPRLVSELGAPPQIVWIRVGNAHTRMLLELFDSNLDSLLDLLDNGAPVVALGS